MTRTFNRLEKNGDESQNLMENSFNNFLPLILVIPEVCMVFDTRL